MLLEKRPALATVTTPVSTGAFRLQFDNPEEMELVRETLELVAELDKPDAGLEVQRHGYLFAHLTEEGEGQSARMLAAQRSWGLDDVEWLSGAEARKRFAYLSPSVRSARFRAGDGWLNPRRLAITLAERSGAAVICDCSVTAFEIDGERITGVSTPAGSISAPTVVLAAGVMSGTLARLVGLELPISPVRRQKLVIPFAPMVPRDAPMTIEFETGAHWRPALQGAFALWTAPAPPEPPSEEVTPTAEFAFGLLDPRSDHALARVAPFWKEAWEWPGLQWLIQAGQYDYTPDHRPLLGPSAFPGLYLNTGFSGHGVMTSAGAARRVVETITRRIKPEENPFRPDRPMRERQLDVL